MSDTPPVTRSSVLFALGRLEAQAENHAAAIKDLPDRVIALVGPRLTNLETGMADVRARLVPLETERWIIRGATGLIVICIGWLVAATKPLSLHVGH